MLRALLLLGAATAAPITPVPGTLHRLSSQQHSRPTTWTSCNLTNFWTETNWTIAYGVHLTQSPDGRLAALPVGGPAVGWTSAAGQLATASSGWLVFTRAGPPHNISFTVAPGCARLDFSRGGSVWQVLPPPPPPPPPPPGCAAVTARAPCGQPDDSAEVCGWKGCCFDHAGGANACFYPAHNAVPITHVHVIQSCHLVRLPPWGKTRCARRALAVFPRRRRARSAPPLHQFGR